MLIKSKDYGELEIDADSIIAFPDGMYAFEDFRRYVVLNTGSGTGLLQLQCADAPDPRFIILDPYALIDDYAPVLPVGTMERLGAVSVDELTFFVVAVIPGDIRRSTVNLKSPVVIHFAKKLGAQVVLDNDEYPVRFHLFEQEREDAGARHHKKAR